ncbi:hypothetical protein BCEN4_940017 [Burkholderia cenocepacia]|nr:hypothetical protein BCEN4_940017 [Burkholderia cenocepacia]
MAALFFIGEKTQYKSEGLSGRAAPAYRCRAVAGRTGAPYGRVPRRRGTIWPFFLACVATDKQNGAGRCRFGASFPSS